MPSTTRYELVDSIIYQTVQNETVIINLDNGRYYSLNPTASIIWEALMQGANSIEIVQLFLPPDKPDAPLVSLGVEQFIDELTAENLLTPAPARSPVSVTSSPSPTHSRYDPPKLDTFTDMQDLIPLDPIHQVGTLGWPYRKLDEPDTAP